MNANADDTAKDMFLPQYLFGFGVFCLALSLVFVAMSVFFSPYCIIGFVIFFTLGFAAVLCRKNQWAIMNGDDEFTYSTMFGNKKQYRFSDITGIKPNSDSCTLIFDNGKVHIESIAVLSERFSDAIKSAIENKRSH